MRIAVLAAAAVVLAGCAALDPADSPLVVPALLLGEQHDAPEHQQLHRQVIEALADRQVLAAVVVEMAERGRTTATLGAGASEEQVKTALSWKSWPWEAYGPVVMAAVRAGVPVLGANITRDEMRAAMRDDALEALIPPQSLRTQHEAIRQGHCGLLPEQQVAPMARIQIARDRAMAQAVSSATQRGKTVVLVAGARHVDADGVPRHLPRSLQSQAHAVVLPGVDTGKDYCEELRKQLPAHKKAS
jgi:uncharacterized iron-regulated protein